MSSNDQTALLPRQPAGAPVTTDDPPVPDAWEHPTAGNRPATATGRAVVCEGVDSQRRALGTLARTLPTILTAVLALIRPAWPSLAGEELTRWGYTVTPWSAVWRLHHELDPLTVPYLLALKCWALLAGTSDFALRLPSVLAMTAAAGLVAALGTRLCGPRVGFLAGLIFAVLPTTSRYAHHVGPQALTTCLAVLATLCLVRVFDRPRYGRLAGYAAAVAALGLTGPMVVILLVAHAAAVLAVRRRVLIGWLAAALLGLVPAGAVLTGWGDPPRVRLSFTAPVGMAELARLPAGLFEVTAGGWVPSTGAAVLGGLLLGLAVLSLSFRRPGIVFTAWAVVPALALYGAAWIGWWGAGPAPLRPDWDLRHLLLTLPAWALLAANALDRAPMVRGVAAALVVTLLCLPAQVVIRQRDGHGQDSAAAAAVIAAQFRAGDVIVYPGTAADARTGRDIVARYVPADRRPADALAHPRRVWLLRAGAGAGADPLGGLPAATATTLRERYFLDQVWTFTGLRLARLRSGPAVTPPGAR